MSDAWIFEFKLDKVICHDDGEVGNAEPYLWQVFFKIDGETLSYDANANTLQGHCKIIATDGRHGNLPSMSDGDQCDIPKDLGYYSDWLVPISFIASMTVPPIAGSVTILMEEDAVSDHGAKCGYQALVDTLQSELDNLMIGKFWDLVNIYIGQGEQAVKDYLDAFESDLKDKVKHNIKEAIKNHQNFFQNIGSWLDPDDQLGCEIRTYGSSDIGSSLVDDFDFIWDTKHDGKWEVLGAFAAFLFLSDGNVTLCPVSTFTSLAEKDEDPKAKKAIMGFKESIPLIRDFRSRIFKSYPGFRDWWQSCRRYTKDLIFLALRNDKIKQQTFDLIARLPSLAKNPEQPLTQAEIETAENILSLMISNGDRKLRSDLTKVREVFNMRKGTSAIAIIQAFDKAILH
jgi:hypothetical protein